MDSSTEAENAGHTAKTGQHGRLYNMECIVREHYKNQRKPKAYDVCLALENILGEGTVYCCSPRNDGYYEVTLSSKDLLNNLHNSITVNDEVYTVSPMVNEKVVVSFMNLPSYITDEEIYNKLGMYGIMDVETIQRRRIQGTQWEDGTRFTRVKFPAGMSSLPYTMKFKTHEGYDFFKVIHNNQTKVCFHCLSEGHEKWECPSIQCQNCGHYGHIQYNCHIPECHRCGRKPKLCKCFGYDDIPNEDIETIDKMFPSLRRENKEGNAESLPQDTIDEISSCQGTGEDTDMEEGHDEAEPLSNVEEDVLQVLHDLVDRVCEKDNSAAKKEDSIKKTVSVVKTGLKAKMKKTKWKIMKPKEDIVKAHIGGRPPKKPSRSKGNGRVKQK